MKFSNEEMRDRYQRASDHFCHTQLDLPTPITATTNNIPKNKNQSWSSSSSTNSSSFLDQTRNTRHSKKEDSPFFFLEEEEIQIFVFSGLSNTSFITTSS